jgi:ribose/xylose/arabinose/galactoside ABC-type transport system permease subunit
MPSRNPDLRFTLTNLFVIVALLAVALSAALITGSIALSIHLSLVVIGWIMYRFMQARQSRLAG